MSRRCLTFRDALNSNLAVFSGSLVEVEVQAPPAHIGSRLGWDEQWSAHCVTTDPDQVSERTRTGGAIVLYTVNSTYTGRFGNEKHKKGVCVIEFHCN
jgi:hypothetical protein